MKRTIVTTVLVPIFLAAFGLAGVSPAAADRPPPDPGPGKVDPPPASNPGTGDVGPGKVDPPPASDPGTGNPNPPPTDPAPDADTDDHGDTDGHHSEDPPAGSAVPGNPAPAQTNGTSTDVPSGDAGETVPAEQVGGHSNRVGNWLVAGGILAGLALVAAAVVAYRRRKA